MNIIDLKIFSDTNLHFFKEYSELLITRLTHANMSLEKDLGNPDSSKNAIRLKDNMDAFKMLIQDAFSSTLLTEEMIINVANKVNQSAMYISNGYRSGGGSYIVDTKIPISRPLDIANDMKTLIENYNSIWGNLDPFEKEARLHISFIRIHPFEDGNGRTGRLILNYNLLRQSLAPVIITTDLEEYYHSYIQDEDVEGLANLFRIQSIRENEVIGELYARYKEHEHKMNCSRF